MTRRALALVANFHRERRLGRKTANFLGHVHARLASRGIDFNIEFVLDRPDEMTAAAIERVSAGIAGSRIHFVDFANLGISRTFGVNSARADVVCFTDGDDFFSFDWFEGALDYFSRGHTREVLHTQYMVGFDQEQFIRETTQTTDDFFDPLALAVDWYWSANLAIQGDVFASVPIEPYDHASGFGSEDWHWSCNCLAAGIHRVSLPGSSYYYRVKPERFALGKVADVIHMASPLFALDRLPPPPVATITDKPEISSLTPEFFKQAREVEKFELGLSYLRSVEAGATEVRHFKPHTPPIVGSVLREVLASGFGDGSSMIFFDVQRMPGGFEGAAALSTAIIRDGVRTRLYVVDGDQEPCGPRADGYAIHLGSLRSSGLYNEQIDRLIARFMIQNRALKVFNILSPRNGSRALAFSRATRGSVECWVNIVLEHGFDALSEAYEELDQFASAGVPSMDIALFRRTADEAWKVRRRSLGHLQGLEAAYVAGAAETADVDLALIRLDRPPDCQTEADGASTVALVRLEMSSVARNGVEWSEGGWLRVDDRLRDYVATCRTCVFVGGSTFVGEELQQAEWNGDGVLIPALTIVREAKPPAYYFRPTCEALNASLKSGRIPADLAWVGAFAVSGPVLREFLDKRSGKIHVAELIARALRAAWDGGKSGIGVFSAKSVVSASSEDLECLGGPRLARHLGEELENV